MACLWTTAMIYGSLMSLDSLGGGQLLPIPHGDKVIHCTAYAGFIGLWLLSIRHVEQKHFVGLFLIGFVIGTSIEFLQYYVTADRRYEILDIIANLTGLLLGAVAYIGLSKNH